jgi:hypothetical protein
VKWLTELEALAVPENERLLERLRQVRDALAAHLANDHEKNTTGKGQIAQPLESAHV